MEGGIRLGGTAYRKVSRGEIRGWVSEGIIDLLPANFFEDPVSFVQKARGRVVKESRLRWAALFPLTEDREIFLKRDRTKGRLESIKFLLLPSKGRKEWFIAHQLRKSSLSVPRPLGWLERIQGGFVKESYYLSEAIRSALALIDDLGPVVKDIPTVKLAKTVKKMHASGLFHQDFHGGNLLWDGEAFFLTDLHSAKILRSLSMDQKLWNLSQLFHSLRPVWGEEEHRQFLEIYFEGEGISPEKREGYLKEIHSSMGRLQKRQWKSRTKRCLKESTDFTVRRDGRNRYYHRREYPIEKVTRVIRDHHSLVNKKPEVLVKNAPEVVVSMLHDGEREVCVKHFRYPRLLDRLKERFRRSKGLRAWISANGLRARGVPSLIPFALAERRDWLGIRESYFLMERARADEELDRCLFRGFQDFEEKRLFIRAFAGWLSRFHQLDLYHKDMKTCNIMGSRPEGTWRFHLLDLEDVRLDEKIDEKKLFRSLLQLNTSTPRNITLTDRLRFLKEYTRWNPLIQNEKSFIRRLAEESRKRGLVYVSPSGVVIEPM